MSYRYKAVRWLVLAAALVLLSACVTRLEQMAEPRQEASLTEIRQGNSKVILLPLVMQEQEEPAVERVRHYRPPRRQSRWRCRPTYSQLLG